MRTKTTKISGLIVSALLAITLTAPSLAEAGRGHGHHGHHHHGHHHHIVGEPHYIYNQPRGYYRPYYPQPQIYPAPVYAVPPQMMLGIDTGHASFMLRF